MHLETFLYMLLQSSKSLPPPGVASPDFESLAMQASLNATPNEWFIIPEQRVSIGLDDVGIDANSNRYFGWDNEKPRRETLVPSFVAKARPITNGEYAMYLEECNICKFPASWAVAPTTNSPCNRLGTNGQIDSNQLMTYNTASKRFLSSLFARTVFGFVPLQWALDWPLIASYDELQSFAKWMNCRIPSFEEVKSLYKYAAQCKAEDRMGESLAVNGIW
jgi:formylglycine-generating enzyme required for sulfatase activity